MVKKIPKKINNFIRDFVGLLEEDDISVKKVILYGSYVSGKATKTSDIDIAVVSDDFGDDMRKNNQYLFRKLWKLKNPIIEPIGYSSKEFGTNNPSPLLYEIRKKGVEIEIKSL